MVDHVTPAVPGSGRLDVVGLECICQRQSSVCLVFEDLGIHINSGMLMQMHVMQTVSSKIAASVAPSVRQSSVAYCITGAVTFGLWQHKASLPSCSSAGQTAVSSCLLVKQA